MQQAIIERTGTDVPALGRHVSDYDAIAAKFVTILTPDD
jgi:hypothetical protein